MQKRQHPATCCAHAPRADRQRGPGEGAHVAAVMLGHLQGGLPSRKAVDAALVQPVKRLDNLAVLVVQVHLAQGGAQLALRRRAHLARQLCAEALRRAAAAASHAHTPPRPVGSRGRGPRAPAISSSTMGASCSTGSGSPELSGGSPSHPVLTLRMRRAPTPSVTHRWRRAARISAGVRGPHLSSVQILCASCFRVSAEVSGMPAAHGPRGTCQGRERKRLDATRLGEGKGSAAGHTRPCGIDTSGPRHRGGSGESRRAFGPFAGAIARKTPGMHAPRPLLLPRTELLDRGRQRRFAAQAGVEAEVCFDTLDRSGERERGRHGRAARDARGCVRCGWLRGLSLKRAPRCPPRAGGQAVPA